MKSRFLSIISKSLFIALFTLVFNQGFGQIPQVPREIIFADLTLKLNEQARREIQLDVDALHRNQTYFKIKLDRVNLYMPIIERELQAIGVPLDLKYLVIQESSLISDAVSTSNAVGFWQFKKGTAEEVFLRVDNQIDERKNIVSSTQGAARYLKKNNSQFDNWMCGLVAYQMGLGGAKSYFGTQYNGKKVVELDRNTHWYFKKFLAHKIAFEGQIGRLVSNTGYLEEISVQGPTTLKAVAARIGVPEAELKAYNKWTSNGQIPGDKTYSIVYVKSGIPQARPAVAKTSTKTDNSATTYQTTRYSQAQANSYPKVTGNTAKSTQTDQILVNDIEAVQAATSTSQDNFTDQIGMRSGKFRRINDLDKKDPIEAGQYYYTAPKKGSADAEIHIVQQGETLWSISQKYGIKLSSLKAKNRIRNDKSLQVGMVLNLQEHRKRGEEIKVLPVNQQRQPAPIPQAQSAPTQTSQPITRPVEQTKPTQQASPTRISHTVSQGENLFRISQKYGVKIEEIKRWNNLSSDNIQLGQKLIIFKP
ncbi:transglycosylase family protein,LysM domain-containing protein [Belliella baltica DSM 15883]|uniref:Transglycosylase family protein,LysM domain-containing protein n=1 Tax=Belliella baltica (strain DSM 15883 / CIP 108006 / LMG 21964 / BA134) TaxID=866536 RepID=I3Z5C9_BELBD|nr:LysM peptidoglycan-binding domain-containing protein [Belliella baltica]AFL84447.1 transglycosylase family protein,LysM domain-containing protein [Belliella baltica DSM 15883]